MRVARRGWVTNPRTYGILRIRVHDAYAVGLLFRKHPICSCPHPCRLSLFVSPILSRARSVEADCLILEIQLKLHHRFGFPCSPLLDLVCNPDHTLKDFFQMFCALPVVSPLYQKHSNPPGHSSRDRKIGVFVATC